MKRSALLVAAAATGIVVILAIAFAVSQYSAGNAGSTALPAGSSSLTSSGNTFSTNSIQGGNQTYVATLQAATEQSTTATTATSMSTSSVSTGPTLSSTSISSSFTTSSTRSQNGGDSYSYSASSQVKILSVEATVSDSQPGDETISFWVNYENIGSSDIYVLEGGGSGLNATIVSGASLIKEFTGARCEIVALVGPLSPGSNQTAFAPGCWSGYQFELLEPGTIGVELTLSWFMGFSQGEKGSISINAEFSLS